MLGVQPLQHRRRGVVVGGALVPVGFGHAVNARSATQLRQAID